MQQPSPLGQGSGLHPAGDADLRKMLLTCVGLDLVRAKTVSGTDRPGHRPGDGTAFLRTSASKSSLASGYVGHIDITQLG